MKCPFCAEDIQEEARLCRFCGATRGTDGTWLPPHAKPKRDWTLWSSGWLFLLSAVMEVASVTSAVPLAGAVRGGAVAFLYHAVFAALFAVLGTALVQRKPWTWRATAVATVVYSVDKLGYVLDGTARHADVAQGLGKLGVGELVGTQTVDSVLVLSALLSLACFWGFAVLVYLRRPKTVVA